MMEIERGTKMRNMWISSSTDFGLFGGSVGSCGKLSLGLWEQSLESEVQLLTKDGWNTDHLNNVHIHKSMVPDEMGLRVPRELAGVTATLSSPNHHGDGECPWWVEKGNITPTFNRGNASPASLTPCPEIHEANPSGNHNLPNQIFLVLTTQRVSETELLNNCYFMLSLLLFCTSDPAASVSSHLEWHLFVPYLQLQQAQVIYMRQKYIFHVNLGTQRCWIHSGHCALSGAKDLLLLEVTLGMKSVVEEEHGISMCSFVC